MAKKPRKPAPFPTRQQLLAYIKESGGAVDKKRIAQAFHIRGDDRRLLRDLLRELEREGLIEGSGRDQHLTGQLPPVTIVEITGLNEEGEPVAVPVKWKDEKRKPPHIVITGGQRGQAPAKGERALVKLKASGRHRYEATVLRILPQKTVETVLGVYQQTKRGGLLEPVNRKQKQDYFIAEGDAQGVQSGELVLAQVRPQGRNKQLGLPEARVIERLGDMNSPKVYSLIAIYHHDIPVDFSEDAIVQAKNAEEPTPDGRIDLRDIPLITIDGADARDFDDAVWAEPTRDGWHLLVAIADVAHYVPPDSALDKEALNRGNSTYFPDRVVPMLPEALSNGLCSLNPHVDRYCLAVHLWINKAGELQRYEFVRGIMRSQARMTYEQVQQGWDRKDKKTKPVLEPLYGAYEALQTYRSKRGALELDLPEYQIVLGEDGHVDKVAIRTRLDSHKLIEEFMITANVAAADAIERKGLEGIFRIHETPAADKVEDLRTFLKTMTHSLPAAPTAHHFNRLLRDTADLPEGLLIANSILRSQMQAYYTPKNLGHFGLGLEKYCHFTSPIRRYADLVVHRALIAMLHLEEDRRETELPDRDRLGSIADHISTTERNSMLAEREANDRYITAYMADHKEAEFQGTVTSVGHYGLFVTLKDTGASGLIRMGDLGDDFYIYEEKIHSLIGRHSGQRFQLGQRVVVTVQEADTQLGSLRFNLIEAEPLTHMPEFKPAKRSRRPRPDKTKTQKPRRGKNKKSGRKKRR